MWGQEGGEFIGEKYDEMWSFVHDKSNKQWLWLAVLRRTRQVVAFHIGNNAKAEVISGKHTIIFPNGFTKSAVKKLVKHHK